MAKNLQRLNDVMWSVKSYTPKELSARKNSFPMIVRIKECSTGEYFYNKFSEQQILYLHSVKDQFRFLAMDDYKNEVSIAINSSTTFFKQGLQPVALTKYMPLPQRININLQDPKQDLSNLLSLTEDKSILLTVTKRGHMPYIMGICLSTDEVSQHIECIPVEYRGMRLSVALDLPGETIEEFNKFEESIFELINEIYPGELDNYQGNIDFIVNARPNFLTIVEEISSNLNYQPITDIHQASKAEHGKKNLGRYKEINQKDMKTKDYEDLISVPNDLSDRDYDYPDLSNILPHSDNEMQKRSHNYDYPFVDIQNPWSQNENLQYEYDYPYMEMNRNSQLNNFSHDKDISIQDDGYLIPNAHLMEQSYSENDLTTKQLKDMTKKLEYHDGYLMPNAQKTNTENEHDQQDDGYLIPNAHSIEQQRHSETDLTTNVHLKDLTKKLEYHDDGYLMPNAQQTYRENDVIKEISSKLKCDTQDGGCLIPNAGKEFVKPMVPYRQVNRPLSLDESLIKQRTMATQKPVVPNKSVSTKKTVVPKKPVVPNKSVSTKKTVVPKKPVVPRKPVVPQKPVLSQKPVGYKKPAVSKNNNKEIDRNLQDLEKTGKICNSDDLPDKLEMLTVEQIGNCLKLMRLDKHIENFKENTIDGSILCGLTKDILINDLGLTSFEALKLKKFVDEKWLPNVS